LARLAAGRSRRWRRSVCCRAGDRMNASGSGPRDRLSVWFGSKLRDARLFGSNPDAFRITASNAAFAGVRTITPTLCLRSVGDLLIPCRAAFRRALPGSQEGDHSTTTFCERWRRAERFARHYPDRRGRRKIGHGGTPQGKGLRPLRSDVYRRQLTALPRWRRFGHQPG